MKLKTVKLSDVADQPADEQVVEQVERQEVDQTEAESPAADDLYWAEVKLAGAMSEVERARAQLEESIQDAQNLVGVAEAELARHESTLSNLKSEHKSKTQELLTLARKLMKLTDGKTMPRDDDEELEDSEASDGWRDAVTAELLDGVKGLSKKKLDSIVAVAATVGALADLRAEASKSQKTLHAVMPKGIGASVASKIESRLAEYIADWSRRHDDPDRAALADELVAEIRELAIDWEKSDCLPEKGDDEHLHAGFSAYNAGKPHSDFLSEDRAKARSWMTGWVGAERLKEFESQKMEQSA